LDGKSVITCNNIELGHVENKYKQPNIGCCSAWAGMSLFSVQRVIRIRHLKIVPVEGWSLFDEDGKAYLVPKYALKHCKSPISIAVNRQILHR